MKIDFPNPSLVKELLGRYASIRLSVKTNHLAEGDRLALGKLVEAASWIDRIYWNQRSEEGWSLKQRLSASSDKNSQDLERLLTLNFGPWDTFDSDRPFCGSQKKPPGGNFYPPDLTREEFEQYLSDYPAQAQSLLSHTTLVRRQNGRLIAITYEEAYKEELEQVEKSLMEASKIATHPGFRAFLQERARALRTGCLTESEKLWVHASDSPIDIAIGPYEVYDDDLMGVKTSYEATVIVRHHMTERLAQFETVASELDRRLPGAVATQESKRRFAIGVYDVIYTAGMTNMGGKAIAATLPNDERVRSEVGARLLLFRNVISAKFDPILKPLGRRILRRDQISLVEEDAFVYHTLLHEMAHALSTCYVMQGNKATKKTINAALKEHYSTIEECRADLLGMVFTGLLVERKLLPSDMLPAAAVTFIVNSMRALRFGAGDDYGRGAAIILSHLLENKSIKVEADSHLFVDAEGVHRAVRDLAQRVQDIATRGDHTAAKEIIQTLGPMPNEIQTFLPRFSDVPVDLEFVFDNSWLS